MKAEEAWTIDGFILEEDEMLRLAGLTASPVPQDLELPLSLVFWCHTFPELPLGWHISLQEPKQHPGGKLEH
ncbi:hypothetical protein TURU_094801 [Turdus rufiventris]|nr:hypothetical protein TURU_094801 [Turdus rufiventris]